MNGGILQSDSRCRCVNGYVGSKCQRLMRDCKEGFAAGFGYGHGQYFIQPASASTPFKVFCRMWFGGRTIIQWRKDSFQEPFNRSWAEYRDGFGRLGGDHWLGLEKMYHICKPGTVVLTIEIRFENTPNDYKQQGFYHFSLSNEKDDYRMHFSHSEGIEPHSRDVPVSTTGIIM
ncbi:angiopoietin-related protein 5-like [Haliotis rufescens]|uniref:angiopoietin-related protein 5-like n=1 Tax=Haliotis rufescens TaxID=6454 RepID=UPI00201E767C|nr:angiopoietin-related protein 5-like [Haliotis rufescens]